MANQNLKTDETTFTISGRLKVATLIFILAQFIGLGGLIVKVNFLDETAKKLEEKICVQQSQYNNMIGTLIRIEENAKFLKEKLEDLRHNGGNK